MDNRDNHYREYLAGEVAEDHSLGLMTRREALRRLGMMGFSAMGASALLAACGGGDDDEPSASTTASSGPSATDATPTTAAAGGTGTEAITFPSGRATPLTGAWAPAPTPKGAVVVIHENRGLVDHIRSVAARLARDGYSALAVDLLSEEGGSAKVGEADAGAALNAAAAAGRLGSDVKATVDELARRQPGSKLGVIGFCFGGTAAWSLLGTGDTRVSAAAPFYGTVEPDVDFAGSRAAVLGVYGELDTRVNATRDTAKAALEKAGLVHELRTFPGANHAFFNDTNPARYDATQAAAAYQAVLDWFGRHLA
jgi:carboxymethylenebutenolidase